MVRQRANEQRYDRRITKPESRSRDTTALLIGVVSIVGGLGTGLFSDLRSPGKVIGLAAFAVWVVAIGLILADRGGMGLARWATAFAFGLTSALLVYAFMTGPRLSDRALLLTQRGVRTVQQACPGAAHGREVVARVALNQLDGQFVHIELRQAGCSRANRDIRIRADDLQAVLPTR